MRKWLLLMRCRLQGSINCSRQLCVPYIQRRSADPTASIPPRILSGSNLFPPLPLYKALKKLFFLSFFRTSKNFRELQRLVFLKRTRPLSSCSHSCEKFSLEQISESFRDYCTDTHKFLFLHITLSSSRPSSSALQFI